ncbi:MAG: DUF3987 domain-containing protein [Paludibacteraceae bacterium]|nr:DUF3987 domain-containing protein [Paludibacteraceae bacterium]
MILEVPDDSLFLTTSIREGQLPEFLEKAISVADITAQKDMLLISALTAASFAMPHIRILHGRPQHIYSPNLISLIVAPPASGKGVMNNAELLLEPINEFLQMGDRSAIYSGDFSSSSFVRTLAKNDGEIFMIQTEMDKMGKNWKQSSNDFSDMFRQAFEHETIRYSRSTGTHDTIDIRIKNPRLSVLLSGTMDQLRPLVGDGQNGLASRFLPYFVDEKIPFDPSVLGHGDSYEENGVHVVYKQLSEDLFRRWQYLSSLDEDLLFSLTPEQSQALGELFADAYNLAFEPDISMPEVFDATVKRLLVIILRIGAILTTLRLEIPGNLSTVSPTSEGSDPIYKFTNSSFTNSHSVLYCSDQDFQTLTTLSEKLLRHAALMILTLTQPQAMQERTHQATKASYNVIESTEKLLEALPNEFSYTEMLSISERLGIPKTTMKRRKDALLANKIIAKKPNGHYVKL